MNDFTKEDLEIIHLDMCTYVERFKMLKESPSHEALRNKLQSMIDNYCEHKRLSPTDALNIPLHCLDCGEKLE